MEFGGSLVDSRSEGQVLRCLQAGGLDTSATRSLPTLLYSTENSVTERMPSANDIRRGQVIKYNGNPHLIIETTHRTPGNLRAFVQVKMRNLIYGKSLDQRFSSSENVEVLHTERRNLEFSYVDRDAFAFMDPDTFETVELSAELIGDSKNYLMPNGMVEVLYVDGKALTVDLPPSVVLEVTESAEGIKGDTASNVQKPATLETGLVVQVPLFIKEGEKLKISTTDGSYMGRA